MPARLTTARGVHDSALHAAKVATSATIENGEDLRSLAERGVASSAIVTTCNCAHDWRSLSDDAEPEEHVYRCNRCGRGLKRRSDLSWRERRIAYLRCEGAAGLMPCEWPSCVAVPRTIGARVHDRFLRIMWWLDASPE